MGLGGTTLVDAASADAMCPHGDWGHMNKDMLQQVGMLLVGQDIAAARQVCATWRKGISWGVRYLRPRTVPNAGAAPYHCLLQISSLGQASSKILKNLALGERTAQNAEGGARRLSSTFE